MNKKNLTILGIFFLIGIFFIIIFSITIVSSAYLRSNAAYTSGINFDYGFGYSGQWQADRNMCEAGQDFVIQIAPFGCEPAVVRSDLLEERNAPVYCQLAATKINPLIKVDAIESISFSGRYPKEISGIGFHPAKAALGVNGDLNSPILSNIGYMVIVLRQQPNESAMPDYVSGNLTAEIRYDIENAYGMGKATFYLPVLTNEEWESKKNQYSFWKGKGYLRADGVEAEGASISVYDGTTRKISFVNLEKGQTSEKIYLPGFDCLAGLQLKLEGLEAPDTRAKLDINGETVEVAEGEEFLEGRCRVRNIDKSGLVESVELKCREDESGFFSGNSFELSISPRIELSIDGKNEVYNIGDYLYDKEDKRVYLGFINTFGNTGKEEDLYGYLIAVPASINQDKLTKKEISSLAEYDKGWVNKNNIRSYKDLGEALLKFIGSTGIKIYKWAVDGNNIKMIKRGEKSSFEKDVEIIGFAGAKDEDFKISEVEVDDLEVGNSIKEEADYNKLPVDSKVEVENSVEFIKTDDDKWEEIGTEMIYSSFDMSEHDGVKIIFIPESSDEESSEGNYEIQNYYDSALKDYDKVINSYPSEKLPEDLYEQGVSAGEEALYRKITLAYDLGQRKTAADFCNEFENRYSDSKKNLNEFCKEDYKSSSSEISTAEVMINRELRRISFDGIYEPNLDEFSARIFIEGTGGKRNDITLTKNQIYYLSDLRGENEIVYYSSRSGEFRYGLYLSFSSGKWKWSMNKENWLDITETEIPDEFDEKVDTGTVTYIHKNVRDVSRKLAGLNTNSDSEEEEKYTINNEDKELFSELKKVEKDFPTGKKILEEEKFTSSLGVEYIKLIELDENSAELVFNLHPKGFWNELKTVTVSNDRGKLEKDTPKSFGSDFIFTLKDINLQRQAKVSLNPSIDNAGTKTNISFKIGIEKRAIQLSPEKINEKLKNLNKSIEEWEEKSEKLGKVVKGLKTACLATGLYLSVKNFFTNADGKSIARTQVMRGKGGWNDNCSKLVSEGKYSTMNECFTKNADKIDNDVDKWYKIIQNSDERYESLQEGITKSGWFGERVIDDEALKKKLFTDENKNKLINELGKNYGDTVEIDGRKIPISEIVGMINENTTSITDYRDLEALAEASGDSSLKKIANPEIKEKLTSIYVNNKDIKRIQELNKETEDKDGPKTSFSIANTEKIITDYYDGYVVSSSEEIGRITEGMAIKGLVYKGKEYYLELKKSGEEYFVENVYDLNGKLVSDEDSEEYSDEIKRNLKFKKYDKEIYHNKYENSISDPKNPVLRYYETEPYAGMPALVPFDLKNGWYASIRQTLPVMGNLQSYDKSGRVTNFYVCNVGENEKEENRRGDDICQGVNTGTGQLYNQFHGLSSSEALKIIECAREAIEQASRYYGESSVRIRTSCDSFSIKVGKPEVDVPEVQCQDFMSPTECKWLFNVCDPVICPSSRCNLGGAYHVKDVIQSGIIGSIFLCLPNIREEIYIPVCLTGIQAGIDGYISVLKSHRDCLEEALNDGKMIGICDEMHSIYICEFFWRQALPITEMIIPKMMEWMMGKNVHGGGEYLSVQDAWNNAEKSADYFTNYYASTSFEAFKSGVVESVGTEICRSSISGTYPNGKSLLDSLTEPDSPPQYHGRFDEIPYTTATNPPMSQYKVFYHIYAGKNSRAYYQVYLKGGAESSFYHDTPKRIVASGYIPKGEQDSDTPDFIAPSGYKQMCIVVNGQEECGFGEVSTSFAVNYLQDKYLQEQASATDITTEKECISGSASFYSILNPNLQSAAEDVLSPEIYNEGIIRICATKDPGTSTDKNAGESNSRWVPVGYCDDENIKCWVDMESVERVIKNLNIEDETLSSLTNSSRDVLMSEGNYLTNEEVEREIEDINKRLVEGYEADAIEHINKIFDKIFWNIHKVRLLLMRGNAYGQLARELYYKENADKTEKPTTDEENTCEEICKDDDKVVESCGKIDDSEYTSNECTNRGGEFVDYQGTSYCCFYEKETEEEEEETEEEDSLCEIECQKHISNDGTSYSGGYFVEEPLCEFSESLFGPEGKNYFCCCFPIKEECQDTCSSLGHECGIYTICDKEEVDCGTCGEGKSCVDGKCIATEEKKCTDCEGWFSSCDYSKCKSFGNNCYYRGNLLFRENCIDLEDACKEITECEDYSKEECENNPCELNDDNSGINCKLEDEKCVKKEEEIEDRKDISYDFDNSREEKELIESINYAKENLISNGVNYKKCNCGDKCASYAKLIIEASQEYGLPDPLLFLSLMIQESQCDYTAEIGNSIGLMQISSWEICKDELSLDNLEDLKGDGNIANNIKCGAIILKKKYDSDKDGKLFENACTEEYKRIKYYGWEAALRGYNGWGCNSNYPNQDKFVDNIMNIFKVLIKNNS